MAMTVEEMRAEACRLVRHFLRDLLPKRQRLWQQQGQEDLIAPDGVFKYNPLDTEVALRDVDDEIDAAIGRVRVLASEIRLAHGLDPMWD